MKKMERHKEVKIISVAEGISKEAVWSMPAIEYFQALHVLEELNRKNGGQINDEA
jgi:hypothetical protein